jgi:hypothetical protein
MEGGRTAGKTQTILKLVWLCLILRPKTGAIMTQPLAKDIRNMSFATSKKMLKEVCKSLDVEYNDMVERTTISPASIVLMNGSKMNFTALDSESNSRGGDMDDATVEHVIFDECSLYKDLELMGSMRATFSRQVNNDTDQKTMTKYTYIFNPPKNAKDRIYKYLNEYQANTYRIFTTYLDIYQLLPKGAIIDIETEKKQNEIRYRQRYLGETVGVEGLIFPNFSNDCFVDIEKEPVQKLKSFIVSDFGSKDAFVYFQAWHTSDGILIDNAYYHDGASMGDIAPSQAANAIYKDLNDGVLNINYDSILIDAISVKLELEMKRLRKVYDTQTGNITKNRKLQIGLLQSLVFKGYLKFQLPEFSKWSDAEKERIKNDDPFRYEVARDTFNAINIIIEQIDNARWDDKKDGELKRIAPNEYGSNIGDQIHSVDALSYLSLLLHSNGILKRLGVNYAG